MLWSYVTIYSGVSDLRLIRNETMTSEHRRGQAEALRDRAAILAVELNLIGENIIAECCGSGSLTEVPDGVFFLCVKYEIGSTGSLQRIISYVTSAIILNRIL